MIEFPNIPNDNLYKFMTFAGLVIIIASVYFYFSSWTVAPLKELDIKNGNLILAREQDRINSDIIQAGVDYDTSITSGTPVEEAREKLAKYRKTLMDLQKQNTDLLDKRNLQAKHLIEYTNASGQGFFAFWGAVIGCPFGFLLMIVGFWLWYVKIQVYQDQILKNEVLKFVFETRKMNLPKRPTRRRFL